MTEFLKSLSSSEPGNGLATAPCETGNAVQDPSHGVQATAAGVGPWSGYLGDPHRQEMSSPNHPSRPQASVVGTRQAASEASLPPGLYSFQNQDRSGASLSSSDHSHSFTSGYDQLVDISLHLSNLSTHSLNTGFHGKNLDVTDATSALNSVSKVPRHPITGQLETDSGQSKMTTLLEPNRLVKNVWDSGLSNQPFVTQAHKASQEMQGVKFDLGLKAQNMQKRLFGSPEEGSHVNSGGTRGLLPGYDPLFPSQTQHSPGQSGPRENYPPAQTHPTALQSKMDLLRPINIRNTNGLHSNVHNVRVKPPRRLFSSANPLGEKPSIQPLKSGSTVSSSQEHTSDHLSPNQHTHLHAHFQWPPNHPLAGTGDVGSLGSALALRTPVQAAGRI